MDPRQALRRIAVVLFAALVSLPFGAVSAQEEGTRITVELQEFEDSGISGSASLTATDDGGTQVSMQLQGGELDGDHPTHIHTGTCDDFDPDPLYPLETVELSEVNREGLSETTVEDVSLDSLREGDFVILVHQSMEKLTDYLVCGEISSGTVEEAAAAAQGSGDDQERTTLRADAEDDHDAATDHASGEAEEETEDAVEVAEVENVPGVGTGDAAIAATQSNFMLPIVLGTLSMVALLSAIALRRRDI